MKKKEQANDHPLWDKQKKENQTCRVVHWWWRRSFTSSSCIDLMMMSRTFFSVHCIHIKSFLLLRSSSTSSRYHYHRCKRGDAESSMTIRMMSEWMRSSSRRVQRMKRSKQRCMLQKEKMEGRKHKKGTDQRATEYKNFQPSPTPFALSAHLIGWQVHHHIWRVSSSSLMRMPQKRESRGCGMHFAAIRRVHGPSRNIGLKNWRKKLRENHNDSDGDDRWKEREKQRGKKHKGGRLRLPDAFCCYSNRPPRFRIQAHWAEEWKEEAKKNNHEDDNDRQKKCTRRERQKRKWGKVEGVAACFLLLFEPSAMVPAATLGWRTEGRS